jgi:hypothetical protein
MADTSTASNSTPEPGPQLTPTATTPSCAQCSKTAETALLKQCLKCHSVWYCGKDCQKAHFKTHKKVCAGLAQEYSKANEPKMASRAPARGGDRDRGLQKWQVSLFEILRAVMLYDPSAIVSFLYDLNA